MNILLTRAKRRVNLSTRPLWPFLFEVYMTTNTRTDASPQKKASFHKPPRLNEKSKKFALSEKRTRDAIERCK